MTSVLLVVVVFISTAGFNIFSHLCTSSGYQDISVNKIESCCVSDDHAANNAIQKESCCTTDQKFVKLDMQSLQPKTEFISGIQWDIVSIEYFNVITSLISFQLPITQYNRPPPDTGGGIIQRKQSFLI